MKKIAVSVFLVCICIMIYSCGFSNADSSEDLWNSKVEKILKERVGKPINLPNLPIIKLNDSLKTFNNSAPHIITYIDATCGVCIGSLKHWQRFITRVRKSNKPCNFSIYIHSDRNIDLLTSLIRKNSPFRGNYVYDKHNKFIESNNLYDSRFQTLLLDSSNKIVLIGDIKFRPELEELYYKTIVNWK